MPMTPEESINFAKKRLEDDIILSGIKTLVETSSAFQFLADDEDLYTVEDIKVKS